MALRSMSSRVTVAKVDDGWQVTVDEGDGDPHIRLFRREDFALSYAAGQRERLDSTNTLDGEAGIIGTNKM